VVRSGGRHCVRIHPGDAVLLFTRRTANARFKDAADLHAELENYPAAIARYDQVADGSLASNLTKYSVGDYWLRAGLCALAMGVRSQHLVLLRSLSLHEVPARVFSICRMYSPVLLTGRLKQRYIFMQSRWNF